MEHPENMIANYTTPLNNVLDFTDEPYEVALVEVSGQTYLYNINNEHNAKMIIDYQIGADDDDVVVMNIPIEPGRYTGVVELVDALNRSLGEHAPNMHINIHHKDAKKSAEDKYESVDLHENPRAYTLYFSQQYNTVPESLNIDRILGIHFSGPLADVFSSFKPCMDPKLLPSNYGNFIVYVSEIKSFQTCPVYSAELSKPLYLYTDLIEHQYMGNGMTKLLRNFVVPEFGKTGRFPRAFHKEFLHPHYKSVEQKQFRSVNINIRTVTGELAPFAPGELVVKVHFRLKNASTLF